MMNRMVMVMVAVIAVLSVFSGIGPVSMKVWFIEMIWAWGLVGVLALTWTKFRFSMMSYSCFFVWCVLQIIGAHWTFECVPMGWLMEPLGLSRNPFDRIAHFAVGFFAFPLAELFWRNGSVRTRTGAAFFAVMTTVAMAGLWEIVEWLYAAVDGGNAGAAFLGSQGDEWDAQKDILCDTLGALCASVLFLKSSGRIGEIRSHVRASIMVVGIVFILPLFGGVEGSWSGHVLPVEYAQIEQTISPEVLSDIIAFIQEL